MTFYHVYADESRQDAHRYMLYGLVFVPRGEAEETLLADLSAFRLRENLTAEMKWGKVSRACYALFHDRKQVLLLSYISPLARCSEGSMLRKSKDYVNCPASGLQAQSSTKSA
jgi:hypothetical protein